MHRESTHLIFKINILQTSCSYKAVSCLCTYRFFSVSVCAWKKKCLSSWSVGMSSNAYRRPPALTGWALYPCRNITPTEIFIRNCYENYIQIKTNKLDTTIQERGGGTLVPEFFSSQVQNDANILTYNPKLTVQYVCRYIQKLLYYFYYHTGAGAPKFVLNIWQSVSRGAGMSRQFFAPTKAVGPSDARHSASMAVPPMRKCTDTAASCK